MARRRIIKAAPTSSGTTPGWDFSQVGDRCAKTGCSRAREGYHTVVRPGDHPVGLLWFAPVCAPCAAVSLMKPIPLGLVEAWMGPDIATLATALNIPEAEVTERLAA